MNEKQLKEIAILAKKLGFNPETHPTSWVFYVLTGDMKGSDLKHVATYLLLCEIQLWSNKTFGIHLTIDINMKDVWSTRIVKFTNLTEYNVVKQISRNFIEDESTFETALATGILESLKLIKNENN